MISISSFTAHYGLVSLATVLLYLVLLVTYRLWFHPLSGFPGPRLAACTQWYEAYYELVQGGGGRFTQKIRNLHQKYGPIVRISPHELSVNDAAFHDQLYAPQPVVRDKHPPTSSLLGTTKGTFSTIDHHLHRRRRAANSPFFSFHNVTASENLIKPQVQRLCELMWSQRHEALDLRVYFAALSFDCFYRWAFGVPLELLDDLPSADHWDRTVETISTCAPFVKIFPWVMVCARWMPHTLLCTFSGKIARIFHLHSKVLQAATEFAENASKCGQKQPGLLGEEEEGHSETLFSVLQRSKLPLEEKSVFRMAQEGTEMFAAAFTPARALTLAMFHLHSNPSVLATLRKELDHANIDPANILSFKSLDTLPYMRAVMKELLRVGFPVGTRLPLICRDDIVFEDWTIPAQTPVSVNTRDILNDPEVYPNPKAFKPERWLVKNHSLDEKRYYCPWGKGSRMCPGKDFAMREMQITLATLIQRFEFELEDTVWERDIAVTREPFLTATSSGSKGVRGRLVKMRRTINAL